MILTMTSHGAYARKQRVWQLWGLWQRRVIRAFFPATGGSEHLMHNWYCCAEKTDPAGARLADWIKESTWDRQRRLYAALERREAQREHLTHGPHFRPLWCQLCQEGRK